MGTRQKKSRPESCHFKGCRRKADPNIPHGRVGTCKAHNQKPRGISKVKPLPASEEPLTPYPSAGCALSWVSSTIEHAGVSLSAEERERLRVNYNRITEERFGPPPTNFTRGAALARAAAANARQSRGSMAYTLPAEFRYGYDPAGDAEVDDFWVESLMAPSVEDIGTIEIANIPVHLDRL